jgi:hypothetical protein
VKHLLLLSGSPAVATPNWGPAENLYPQPKTVFQEWDDWSSTAPTYGPSTCPAPYSGSLKYVICDIKRSLSGAQQPAISASNHQAVLRGLRDNLGCNGIRIYADMEAGTYDPLYTDVLAYARTTLGLHVYANPLGTGTFGLTPEAFTSRIVDYAHRFHPEFLGPFNESGLSDAEYIQVAGNVRAGVRYAPAMVGPDVQKVGGTLAKLTATPGLAGAFDILGSHSAVNDQGATSAAWTSLYQLAGKPTWATETPREWSVMSDAGVEIGVKAVVESPVQGVVLYLAFPKLVDVTGALTAMGEEIAAGLRNPDCH